jgi:hypothetical protein
MKISTLDKLSFLFLTPYIVGWSSADSSFSEYSVGLGGGQYASYDCAGNAHANSFADAGVKLTHKFEAPFRVGVSTSVIPHDGQSGFIAYPDLALDFKYFSLGTTGLRLGAADDIYGEVSILDQVPFCSGKGFVRAGVGMRAAEDMHLWLGVNTYPYYASGLAGQVDLPLSSNQFMFINGRYGGSGGVTEYGFSIGTRIRVY